MRGFDRQAFELAAANIARCIGIPPARSVLVTYSPPKRGLAERVCKELRGRGLQARLIELTVGDGGGSLEPTKDLVRSVAGSWGLVFLISYSQAQFVFDVVGRPDRGIKLPQDHMYCDYCMSLPGLVRAKGIDEEELGLFRDALVRALVDGSPAGSIRVTTPSGTDIAVVPRRWNLTNGEVFTALVEGIAAGVIVVDGCAYSGPPRTPFTLRIEAGRVANLDQLDQNDEQQRMVRTDLTRDVNAAVLAEFGIGINPGARKDADLMEAEQARGTCHFGFGHNIEYGGANRSSYHFDLVVLRPAITIGERVVCARQCGC